MNYVPGIDGEGRRPKADVVSRLSRNYVKYLGAALKSTCNPGSEPTQNKIAPFSHILRGSIKGRP